MGDGKVIPFAPKPGSDMDDAEIQAAAERDAVLSTLANVLANQQQFEQQISAMVKIVGEMQSRIRDLEHDTASLKKLLPKKPAILNAQGARAN